MDIVSSQAFTHAGRFHADDVFSAALLKIINPSLTILRGYTVPKNFKGLVFDIGLGRYDHHQKNAPIRENCIPYASFGLLWRTYGQSLVEKWIWQEIDRDFIQPLDLHDNSGTSNILADVIDSFNPTWDCDDDENIAFADACKFAQQIIEKQIKKYKSEYNAIENIDKFSRFIDDDILVLNRDIPWEKGIHRLNTKYVIYPSKRGGYGIKPVDRKFYFPETWRDLSKQELIELTGIQSIVFCHKSGFLCTTTSLDDAIILCKRCLTLINNTDNQIDMLNANLIQQ